MKKKNSANSTQQLIGIKEFSRNGVLSHKRGELVFFLIRPTNISVLSRTSIAIKIRHFMQLLCAQPDIEMVCMDDSESFEQNKAYLQTRIESETNPIIRNLLDRDSQFLDKIQVELSTARQFMLMVRLRNESEEQTFSNLNRIQKTISGQGFEVKRAERNDIKRFLTIYFLRHLPPQELPDIDGETAMKKWVIPD